MSAVVRNTSRYPTDEVLELVAFATAEIDMSGVCVNVKNSHRYACGGYAYDGVPSISNAPPGSEYLVTIRLGAPGRFPASLPHRKRSAPRRFACWREGVVGIAAHEAKHVEQYRLGLPRSEVECERFEAVTLRRYRAATTGPRQSVHPSQR